MQCPPAQTKKASLHMSDMIHALKQSGPHTVPSLFAIRLLFDTSGGPPTEVIRAMRLSAVTTPVIERITEFPVPMQCINMAIPVSFDPSSTSPLSGLDNRNFDNSSPTAVASFAMHQGSVDQIHM